jgi:hypothetical protein
MNFSPDKSPQTPIENLVKVIQDSSHQEFYQKRIPKIKDLFADKNLTFDDILPKD